MSYRGIPKPCKRPAARRPTYHARCGCDCHLCREFEQLDDVAQFHINPWARLAASQMIGLLQAIKEGRLGGVSAESLFD